MRTSSYHFAKTLPTLLSSSPIRRPYPTPSIANRLSPAFVRSFPHLPPNSPPKDTPSPPTLHSAAFLHSSLISHPPSFPHPLPPPPQAKFPLMGLSSYTPPSYPTRLPTLPPFPPHPPPCLTSPQLPVFLRSFPHIPAPILPFPPTSPHLKGSRGRPLTADHTFHAA